ncbi:MAG: sugar phosphate isomerase/epimerase, partial [Verrucomicrobiota bacterium]
AELSHGIRISLLPGILQAVDAGEIKISSLHNFCPLPLGVNRANPNIFQFSSPDNREWNNALRYSVKTIETAARVKAQLVVLHLGSVSMSDYTDRLIELVDADQKDSPKYAALCEEVLEKRERRKKKYVERTQELLALLVDHANKHGVKLGLENREALEEIPFESDFRLFLKDFPQPCIGYWHDTGHAQIKENLGFIHHVMHLESVADRLFGFHVHDVRYPARDHCPPGTGAIDFAALKPFVKPEHIKVFEIMPGVPPEDLKRGVATLKAIWGEE